MEGYPFEYRGQVFLLGKLNLRVRQSYCDWLRARMVKSAHAFLEADALDEYLKQAIEPGAVYWVVDASEAVRESFMAEEGERQVARLLLGDQVKEWTDAQLSEMIDGEGYSLSLKLALADSIPTSEEGQGFCAGEDALQRLVSTLVGDPFWQAADSVLSLTYRQAWDWFVAPALEKQRNRPATPASFGSPGSRQSSQGYATSSDDDEMPAHLIAMCGDRVHKGPRWWLGEDPNVKLYNGKEK
jgi:hypothetical protein